MPWGLSVGWPRPVLGNGYIRKLSQPGRHVCGNRKELGCHGAGGKQDLRPTMGRGLAWGSAALLEPPDVPSSACLG